MNTKMSSKTKIKNLVLSPPRATRQQKSKNKLKRRPPPVLQKQNIKNMLRSICPSFLQN
jgi:hypothetical protein